MALAEVLRAHHLRTPKDLFCACGLDMTGYSYEESVDNWAEHVAREIESAQQPAMNGSYWRERARVAEQHLANVGAAYRAYWSATLHDVRDVERAHLFTVLSELREHEDEDRLR